MDYDQDFFKTLKTKSNKDVAEKVVKIKKDKFKVPNLYEFQLYANFEEVKELGQLLQDKIDQFLPIEDTLKTKFTELLATGFPQWSLREYQAFIRCVKKRGFEDVQAIAREVDTKSEEEVEEYMKEFLLRFRELKEKDIVLKKMTEQDFDQRNLQTIRDYDPSRPALMLLQENNFFNRNAYLSMAENAHRKLLDQSKGR